MSRVRGRRWAAITSVAGTVFIAAGAFWLSFTALADLALRSGIGAGQGWAWPLIVDGVIVVSTVAVVALAGEKAAWYPWTLLIGGAAVSVTANCLHAVVAAEPDVPGSLAAAVAAVPPVVLLAITHLTVVLTRAAARAADAPAAAPIPAVSSQSEAEPPDLPDAEPGAAEAVEDGWRDRRALAAELRAQEWSNKAIARHLGVHPSTVGRWLPRPQHAGTARAHHTDEADPSGSEPAMEGTAP
ncbi:helix-turn-helix domain-containing protein [Brevibacterium samyangense]|uniref:Homeodomain-like domain-containing protein n=1 Tax=Brevibacterium samyangense TaxID=366888 RepID=A0ABN2TD64_9MICO